MGWMRVGGWRAACAGALALGAALPRAAAAQSAPRPLGEIDSLLLAGDTASAMTALAARIRADRRDAAAWHRQGLAAWGRARRRHGRSMFMTRYEIDHLRLADSSLRLAKQLEPANARYRLDLARFLMAGNLATTRLAAYGEIGGAVRAARAGSDPVLLADALDAAGMIEWRRYEALADRYNLIGVAAPQINPDTMSPSAIRTYLSAFAAKLSTFSGEDNYREALDRFSEAVAAHPEHDAARRHVYMALAERRRWEELRRAATGRLAAAPWDAAAWMARGLSSHRLGDPLDATASFDSALVLMSAAERERMTRLTRLLRPADTARFAALDPDRRAHTERMYWTLSDPLWMTAGNEHRLEFLARVAYADLRWTSDDFQLRGADTDRGDIHIRYGPPDLIAAFGGTAASAMHTVVWSYADGHTFVFTEPPTWGTARHSDPAFAERAIERQPLGWGNVDADLSIDSIPARLARFRAGSDSADILLLARIPVESLIASLDLPRVPLETHLRVMNDVFQPVVVDTSRALVERGDPGGSGRRAWRRRLAAGLYLYRVEALQRDAGRAARAVGRTGIGDSTFAMAGFGMSDVVLADQALPRPGTSGRRWSEFGIVPLGAAVRPGAPFALLWETYELGARDDVSRYRVEVTLRKNRRSGAAAIAARIASGVPGAAGLASRGSDRITFRYERSVAASPVVVDYFAMDIGAAPPGQYTLRVTVTDLVRNRSTTRELPVRVSR